MWGCNGALSYLSLLLAMAGCGDEPALGDAGPDGSADGGHTTAALVAPPDIPWLTEGVPPIMLAPCAEGWREVHGGDVVECDPYPESGIEACAPGEAHFPGESACRPIGDPCPPGDYGTSVPTRGPVVYVNAAASLGGDGTLAAPFSALSEVPWVSLSASTTVAIGRGTYPGMLPLKGGVSVIGACAQETTVTGLSAPVPSVVTVTSLGEPALVENLSIRGAPQSGAFVRRGRQLSLRGVLIEGVYGSGVIAEDAGTVLTLADVVVRGTEASGTSNVDSGVGIQVGPGARLDGVRVIVANNRGMGLLATGADASVTLSDALVRDTRTGTNGAFGRGLAAELGAQLLLTRLLVSGNHDIGVWASGAAVTLTMVDSVVRDTEPEVDGSGGRGVGVEEGAEFTGTRLLVAGNREIGVTVVDEGSHAVLTDVVIRGTRAEQSSKLFGHGLGLQFGGQCDATRLLISNNTEVGVNVRGAGSEASFTDAVVRATAPAPESDLYGLGVVVHEGAALHASRLIVSDNRGMGLLAVHEGTAVDLFDVIIADTRSQVSGLLSGRGLEAQRGARIDGARLEVERSLQLGVAAFYGAVMVLEDVLVREVKATDCDGTACLAHPFGYGAGAYAAAISLRRFRIVDAAVCGVMITEGGDGAAGRLVLEGGVVEGSEIGACVQVPGYDLGLLTNDVEYRNNGTNLDTTVLPVPDVGDAPGW